MVPQLIFKQLGPGEGQMFLLLSEVVRCKALADDTGGAYTLLELETPPQAGQPSRRLYLEDVAFFVLAGTYVFRLGDRTQELRPGAFAVVPREMAHGYQNVASTPARMLVLISPGGIHERFLAEIGVPRVDGTLPDAGKMLAVAPKYGIEFLSPPG